MIREKLKDFVPPRFHKYHAFRLCYVFAVMGDATLEAALQGVAARFPGFGTDTALPRIASDRGIPRGFQESVASYVLRIRRWIEAHKKQGNSWELMRQVQDYCSPDKPRIRLVVVKGGVSNVAIWRTLNSDGTQVQQVVQPINFDWDGKDVDATYKSRAWLIIYSTPPNEPWTQNGEQWDEVTLETWDEISEETWGSDATVPQIQGLRAIVKEWKGAHSWYPEFTISFDDSLFDPTDTAPPNPDGDWDDFGQRALAAMYWPGTK